MIVEGEVWLETKHFLKHNIIKLNTVDNNQKNI